MADRGAATKPAHGDVLTAISDGLVALLKEYYGKGPTEAKTYYHDDLVVCLLRGGFTRVERTLQQAGHGWAVLYQRMAFHEVMRERFVAVVEKATHRSVIGFMCGDQPDPDMICEVFVLAPSDLPRNEEVDQSVSHAPSRSVHTTRAPPVFQA
jgi:uncharacterized protein YbcI